LDDEASKVLVNLPVGERMVVHYETGGERIRERRATQLTHGLIQEWGVHNNDIVNLARAVTERVFVVKIDGKYQLTPQPTRNVEKALAKFTAKFLFHMPELSPISMEQFIESYTGRKRRMYEKAYASLQSDPLKQSDACVSAFIKDDKIDFGAKPNACGRVIQPRSPRFNIVIGCYLRPFEKAAFRAIAGVFRGVTVAKGLNAFERGKLLHDKWDEFDDPVAIMLDAERFDQHCGRDITEWKHKTEERSFPGATELVELNRMRSVNRCYGRTPDGSVKYTVKGKTMSGDMDTAAGNCLIMCAVTWTVMLEMVVRKYAYINDGDDGVLIVERNQVERVRKDFHRSFLAFGFTMKWDGDTDELGKVRFCQCAPVYDGTEWRMVRDPLRALAKDALTLRRVRDSEHHAELVSATGWCGMSLAGDLPIFSTFYRKMCLDSFKPTTEFRSGMDYMARDLTPRHGPVRDEARLSFWKAFGVSPDNQLALEAYISSLPVIRGHIPTPGAFITDPILNEILNNPQN
jgi:hypothetical protein